MVTLQSVKQAFDEIYAIYHHIQVTRDWDTCSGPKVQVHTLNFTIGSHHAQDILNDLASELNITLSPITNFYQYVDSESDTILNIHMDEDNSSIILITPTL